MIVWLSGETSLLTASLEDIEGIEVLGVSQGESGPCYFHPVLLQEVGADQAIPERKIRGSNTAGQGWATAKMDPAQTTPLSIRTEPLGGPEIPGTPYSVAVLKEGYCHPQPDGSTRADGTITLLSGPTVVLVDIGGPWDRDLLLGRLAERGLGPGDVGWVVCTHGHSDHVGNLSLFPGATLVVGFDVCQGDRYLCTELAQRRPHAIDEHVLIPAIHIHATGKRGCCGNRCGMFLSIAFATLGVIGSLYSFVTATLGLVNGPLCEYTEKGLLVWGTPFKSADGEFNNESYLFNKELWKECVQPKGVVEFNVILFSLILAASGIEMVLCLIQMINGLFGCLCGTCGEKGPV